MGIPWEWELVTKLGMGMGMGIDCTGMGGSGNVKSHSRSSLEWTKNISTSFCGEN